MTDDVNAWVNKYSMPLDWVKENDAFSVIYSIRRNEFVDHAKLDIAIKTLEKEDLTVLSDQAELDRIFVRNVASDKYFDVLSSHIDDVKKKIRASGYNDYSQWTINLARIRKIVNDYIVKELKAEVSEKAKQRVNKLNDAASLKARLDKLLDVCPEACMIILNEE